MDCPSRGGQALGDDIVLVHNPPQPLPYLNGGNIGCTLSPRGRIGLMCIAALTPFSAKLSY